MVGRKRQADCEVDKKELLDAIPRKQFPGIGKPEPPGGLWADIWSRRITPEHQIGYQALDREIEILSCRQHY